MSTGEEPACVEPKPASGMALASAMLGALPYALFGVACLSDSTFAWWRWGVVFFPAAGLAIAFGWLALQRIRQGKAEPIARRFALLGLTAGLLAPILALALAIILPALAKENPHRNRATCQNNLKHIHVCIRMYREEHAQQYPARLSELYPKYLTDLSEFVCPTAGTTPGDAQHIDRWTSYAYSPPSPGKETLTTVIVRDKALYHRPPGRNALYANGHVQFVKQPSAQASLP